MRMTDYLLAGLAALGVLLPMTPPRVLAQSGTVIEDPEAYAVYASVLPARFDSADQDLTRIVLFRETYAMMQCLPEAGPEWTAVIENYKTENARARTLQPGFDLGLPYTLLSGAALNTLIAESTAKTFAQFPNGKILSFSAVGFNQAKTRALVTVQFDCGVQCGGGSHILREKDGNEWVQPKTNAPTCSWIS
jgi:hypothetical protein